MPAVQRDLTVEQGTTWTYGWAVTYNGDPLDDSWTGAAQVRAYVNAPDVLHAFAVEVLDGDVKLSVDPGESDDWTWTDGVYDVEVSSVDLGLTLRVAHGRIFNSEQVTQ